MSDQKPIFLIESNAFARAQVTDILVRYDYAESVEVVDSAPDEADSTVIVLNAPYRAGAVVDRIAALLTTKANDRINIGGDRFIDLHLSLYYTQEDAAPVRLTEKEAAL